MNPRSRVIPDGHRWLRVVDPAWEDPLDPTYAAEHGGRWNPPGSFPTLYLNEDLETSRTRVEALLRGSPVQPDDLDPGFDLIVATLPRSQSVADAVTARGLESLGLPDTYPRHRNGRPVRHEVCQPIGRSVYETGLRGVHARSAVTDDGAGRELAWFPVRLSSRAILHDRIAFSDWFWDRTEGLSGSQVP